MYCPECGSDAGQAKFCPECGTNLSGVKSAIKGEAAPAGDSSGSKSTTGKYGAKGSGQDAGPKAGVAQPGSPSSESKGLPPAILWGGFGAVALIVIIVIIMLSGGFGGKSDSSANGGSGQPVAVDVNGSYADLVKQANAMYDKGDTAFQKQDFEGGSNYFQSAAMTYAAAWKKQATDPGVGTDFATALFYSGKIDAALKQVDAVIAKFPKYQAAYFNLGNYLAHKARIAEQSGSKKVAAQDYAAATKAYKKAIAMGKSSEVGKQAQTSLDQLSQ